MAISESGDTRNPDSILQEARTLIEAFELKQSIHIVNSTIIHNTYTASGIDRAEYAYSLASAHIIYNQIEEETAKLRKQWLTEFKKLEDVAAYIGWNITANATSVTAIHLSRLEPCFFHYTAADLLRFGQMLSHG